MKESLEVTCRIRMPPRIVLFARYPPQMLVPLFVAYHDSAHCAASRRFWQVTTYIMEIAGETWVFFSRKQFYRRAP